MSTFETSRQTTMLTAPRVIASAGNQPPHPTEQLATPRHGASGGVTTSRPTIDAATPSQRASGASKQPQATIRAATPTGAASSAATTPDPTTHPSAPIRVASDQVQHPHPTTAASSPIPVTSGGEQTASGHRAPGTHRSGAAGEGPDQPTHSPAAPITHASAGLVPFEAGRHLAFMAQQLDDIEEMRKATANRLRALTRTDEDKDGEIRGLGLTTDDPSVQLLTNWLATLDQVEHQTTLMLQKLMRKHPLGPFVKTLKGVGDKQAARLVAAIGDPYIRPEIVTEDDTTEPARPRMVSELLAYCGLTPGARRRKGEVSRWNATARMRAWNVIDSCMKQTAGETREHTCIRDDAGWLKHTDDCACSPYRVVYDDARRRYADAVDSNGKALPDAHKHARAQRLMMRALIKDLWAEARRIHGDAL